MNESPPWFRIFITLLIAFILTLLPMPAWTIWWRPAWILMVLIYWAIVYPYQVSIGLAWFIGLFLDVLNGTLLGEHAFALSLVIYLVARMYARLRMYPILQQSACVLLFILLYQFTLYCIQGFTGDVPKRWLYWTSSFSSMLLWPWIYIIMRDYHRRFKAV
jgi:rod shape-determining protein MreD